MWGPGGTMGTGKRVRGGEAGVRGDLGSWTGIWDLEESWHFGDQCWSQSWAGHPWLVVILPRLLLSFQAEVKR